MRRRQLFSVLLGLMTLLVIAPVQPAHATPTQGDEVILGDDLTLHAGEHLDGDLVIIGGNLTMLAGSRVEGSITALGGHIKINGTVVGDLVALGGNVTVNSQARIRGDVLALGGRVRRVEGAQVGEVIQGLAIRDTHFLRGLRLPFLSTDLSLWSTFWAIASTLGGALIMSALGIVIVALWPAQTAQVGETILVAPAPSLGVGCLLYPLAASLIFFLLITICLALFAPLVILLLVAASLLGWVALGTLWGRRLVRWMGWRRATPPAVAGVGVFTLSIVTSIGGAVPCLGPLVVLGAASIGLGAVTLSRFGASRYPSRPAAEPPAES